MKAAIWNHTSFYFTGSRSFFEAFGYFAWEKVDR